MDVNCKAWNPSIHEIMSLARGLDLNGYKDPVTVIDRTIILAELALKNEGCNPDIATTITIPLDEYHLLISDAQKKGRKEAWDLARRITAFGEDTYTCVELSQVFGACNSTNIFNMPPDEAMEKDRAYQKKKEELHVGDEVKFRSTGMPCGYVVETGMSEFTTVLTKDRTTHILRISDLAKTGKHSEEIERAMASFEEGGC